MKFMQKRMIALLCLINCFMSFKTVYSIPQIARDKGFVYLHEVDPTILVSPRYYSNENFMGRTVHGYKKPVVILTRQAADALKKIQEKVKQDGYSLVVYDAYRPCEAVKDFMNWSQDSKDCAKESQYYPRVPKDKLFELDYIAARSGHSRGSTVDLTVIKLGNSLHVIEERNRELCDGSTIKFLDDGTVDMGSSFDMFDEASHTVNSLVEKEFQERRLYLKNIMENNGFKNYCKEWWHFTLKNEPFSADKDESYFDFPIE